MLRIFLKQNLWPNHNKTELSNYEEEKCHCFAKLEFCLFFFVSTVEGRYKHTRFPCRHEVHLLLIRDALSNVQGSLAIVLVRYLWSSIEVELKFNNLKVQLHLTSHFRQVFTSLYVCMFFISSSLLLVWTECFLL